MARGARSRPEPTIVALLLAPVRSLLLPLAIRCPLVIGSAVARAASIAPVRLALRRQIGTTGCAEAAILGGDRPPGQALDVAEQVALFRVAERYGDARGASACRAPDAVNIALRHIRQLEVHDVRDLVDIDAARGDIGCDQHAYLRCPKGRQGSLAL